MRWVATTIFAVVVCVPLAVRAEVCPPPPDQSGAFQQLIEQVQAAPNEISARLITNQMWEIWATAPDAKAQDMLDRGLQYRSDYNLDAAIEAFNELIAYCPDYAEGYNQRAFIRFIRQDYSNALEDLQLALERSPDHIAALSGKALTLFGLGRMTDGQRVLREAVDMNPWLPERGMLVVDPGEDL